MMYIIYIYIWSKKNVGGRWKVYDVDNSINLLVSAGMSSPALRRVASAGVDIET